MRTTKLTLYIFHQYVKDIIDNMEKAENFFKDIDFTEFPKNEKKNYALIR